MGSQQSQTFENLGTAHVKAFILYGRSQKIGDQAAMSAVLQFLVENVDACKSEIKARVPLPGIGLLIGSRFQDSMKAELLLFHDPRKAVAELESCHESIVKALTIGFSQKERWEKLWRNQLIAMLEFVNEDNAVNETQCVLAAQYLGKAFDSVIGRST
jgi:hypothetical protein